MNRLTGRKILVLNTHGTFSGEKVFFNSLISRLRREAGVEFVVGCPRQGPLWNEVDSMGASLVELDVSAKFSPRTILPMLARSAGVVQRITNLLRRENIALVHGNEMKLGLLGFLAARRVGVPTLWYVHDFVTHGCFDRLCYALADRVVVETEAVADRFRRLGSFAHKVVKIPGAIDVAAFVPRRSREAVRAELGLQGIDFVIGTVGRTDRDKNVGALLECLARLRACQPGLVGLIVGADGRPGSTAGLDALKRQAHNLGLDSAVIFTGYRKDVADLMNVMDIFVSTAIAEPFGLTYLEAMAVGKPIVAVRSGGTPEVVPHGTCGLLVQSGDINEMTEAIARLLNDPPLRARFAVNGQRRVRSCFDESMWADRVISLYEELLAAT